MRPAWYPLSAACAVLLLLTACPGPVERSKPCGWLDLPDLEPADTEILPDDDTDGIWEENDIPDADVDADMPPQPLIIQWGSTGDDAGTVAEPAADGSVFVTGGTTGELFGNQNAGSSDLFLTKIGPDREFQWTKQWGTTNFDQGSTLAIDQSGSLYLSGRRDAIVDPFTGATIGRMFISRHTADGAEQWSREWGSFEQEYPSGVSVDKQGNAYVTGWTWGVVGIGSNQGLSDIFLSRFDNAGGEVWSTQWGSGLIDVGYSVAAESTAGIYVTGWTYGNLVDTEPNLNGNDLFLSLISPAGSIEWTRQWGSDSEDKSYSVAIGPDGSVFVGGATTGGIGGFSNIGGEDCFLVKFSAAGEQLWTYQWGSESDDMTYAVTVGPDGTAYAAGFTNGSLGGIANKGSSDIFLTAFSPDGVEQWTVLYGTPEEDMAQSLRIADGWLIVSGWTAGDLGKENAGGYDIFVLFHPIE